MIVICLICHKEFETKNVRKKYCSPKCKDKSDNTKYYNTHKKQFYLRNLKWRKNNREKYLKNHRERMSGTKQRAYMKIACKKYSKTIKGIVKRLNIHVRNRGKSDLEIDYLDVERIFGNREKWICNKCGTGKDLTIDHIIPFVFGGEHKISNIQILCRRCNSTKGCYEKYENRRKLGIN